MEEIYLYHSPSAMDPMFPEGENKKELENLALDLIREDAMLTYKLEPMTTSALEPLVESMNTYYTNKIEGYDTHPLDIERALKGDYSLEPEKKKLQLLAKAHLEVHKKLTSIVVANSYEYIYSSNFIKYLHAEFYKHLPKELREVKDNAGKVIDVIPGQYRTTEVEVQRHIAPASKSIEDFAIRFEDVYSKNYTNGLDEIIKIAAAHHRLLFIHPFTDGNGRVARLFSDAGFKAANKKTLNLLSLWSISRGLARNREEYYTRLHNADQKRWNDYDGRGNLTNRGLAEFCKFFLATAIDQIKFMQQLLDLDGLRNRTQKFCDLMAIRGELPKEAFYLLDEAISKGWFKKKEMERLTGKSENTARKIAKALVDKGFLIEEHKLNYRIAFPMLYAPYLFPNLYPKDLESGFEAYSSRPML